ncbi:rod shape-determining protein MreD [Formivibrio citricus]|uniref:Rod shape-determining protein MreD n=1 Tax=Formivibrio citricus TaxID=83765 RepID=A0A1I5D300_9NEIS|nr:rod shape-determining protein MreD [Formivibrio citricus]SFN93595.1 rod shape-determining protein MreD [Formivibrio citricus]
MPVSSQILRPVGTHFIVLTFLAALLGNLLPWQATLANFAPDFVALLLIYWTLNQPRRIGVGVGFLLGILMDVGDGTVLGQHALAYSVIAFLTLWRNRQISVAPFWQQAISAFLLLLLSQLIMYLVRSTMGAPFVGWSYFAGPVIAAPLWTPLANLMLMHQRMGAPEEL